RATVNLYQRSDFAECQTACRIGSGALQRSRIEAAAPRVADQAIPEAVSGVAFFQYGRRDHRALAFRNRRELHGLCIPVPAHHESGIVERRGSGNDAIEVVGIPLRLHQSLESTVRTSFKV